MTTKTDWRVRAAIVAAEIQTLLLEKHPELEPIRSSLGAGLNHALFLAIEIQKADGMVDSDTKACRWLGYLQCMMVYEGMSVLSAEKQRNLASGGPT